MPTDVAGRAREALRVGVAGGLVLLLVTLVGMVAAFADTAIVHERLTLTDVLLLGVPLAIGYVSARRAPFGGRPPALGAVLSGAVAGLAASLVMAALVAVGTRVDLSPVFVNARPMLYELLTFGRGVGALLAVGTAAAAVGGVLAELPAGWRRAIGQGIVAVVAVGALSNLLRPIMALYRSVAGIEALSTFLLARAGLTLPGAMAVFVATALYAPLRGALRARTEPALAARPEARRAMRWASLAGTVLVLAALPMYMGSYSSEVLDKVGLFVLMGLGLNIVVGFAGLLDLGYVAFYAIGAYTVGVLTAPQGGIGLTFWTALPLAVITSIAAGIVLGIPVLKSHGDYLAIITLGFGEIIQKLVKSDMLKPWLGGAQGIDLIPKAFNVTELDLPGLGRFDPAVPQEYYYPILVACLLAIYVTWRLRNSRIGRAWMAVREDEQVAEGMGINLVDVKLLAFATGAGMAGLSGAVFASKLASIFPDSFGLLISINVLVLIIVGGMGSVPGVIVGALVLVGLPELLREFAEFRMLLYGAVLVLMMLNRPEGLWPTTIARRELKETSTAEGVG